MPSRHPLEDECADMGARVGSELDDRIQFTCAMVERILEAQGLNPAAAGLVEAGLRTGRSRDLKPPDPLQQPSRYYPGLTAKPWHDPADFPWVGSLEAAFPEIREEALALYEQGRFTADELSADLAEGSWHEFRLYTEGFASRENCAAAPLTAEAVARIPGATTAGLVYFAAVGPGTHLRAHFGPHNARLRCHLGVAVPAGCEFRVGSETRSWEEGRVIIFDDSFEHEVRNWGGRTRIVLLLDVWHPDLSSAEIVAIRTADLPVIDTAYEVAKGWLGSGTVPRIARANFR